MFPPKRILFPVDFSEPCDALIPMASEFALRNAAHLTLLHVAPPWSAEPHKDPGVQLAEFAKRSQFDGIDMDALMVTGDPASEIIKFAHEEKTDLIMMPTHGYGPFRQFLFGSVTMKVLHDAWCPVLTDAHTEEPAHLKPEFQTILCAVDLSDKSHVPLRWAAQFADNTGAKLRIVHVIPSVTPMGAEYNYFDLQQEMADAARLQIDLLQCSEGTHGCVEILSGDVASAVRCAAKSAGANFLVIGRSMDGTLMGRLRTHAYPIIRRSPCSVISI